MRCAGNPKHEIRYPKQIQRTKMQNPTRSARVARSAALGAGLLTPPFGALGALGARRATPPLGALGALGAGLLTPPVGLLTRAEREAGDQAAGSGDPRRAHQAAGSGDPRRAH